MPEVIWWLIIKVIFSFLLSNNLIRSSSGVSQSKEMETFRWLPKGFVSPTWKSFTFLTSITLQLFQNIPLVGAMEIFTPPRQCIIGRLLTGEMVAFRLECGKKVDVKTEEKRWLERTNRTSAVLKQILLDKG